MVAPDLADHLVAQAKAEQLAIEPLAGLEIVDGEDHVPEAALVGDEAVAHQRRAKRLGDALGAVEQLGRDPARILEAHEALHAPAQRIGGAAVADLDAGGA